MKKFTYLLLASVCVVSCLNANAPQQQPIPTPSTSTAPVSPALWQRMPLMLTATVYGYQSLGMGPLIFMSPAAAIVGFAACTTVLLCPDATKQGFAKVGSGFLQAPQKIYGLLKNSAGNAQPK